MKDVLQRSWPRLGRYRPRDRRRVQIPWCFGLSVVLYLFVLNGEVFAQATADAPSQVPVQSDRDASDDELRRQAAIQQFLSAVALAKSNLGATYYIEGLYDSAAVHLRDALTIAPDFAAAYLTLGLVYYAQGKKEDAILAFKAAAAGDTLGQRRMGLVHPDTVHTWAKTQFNKMLQGTPRLAVGHTTLAMLYAQGGYIEDAEKHYLQAIRSDSVYVDAYTNLGKFYTDTERFDEAIRVYEKALTLQLDDKERAKVYLNTGVSYMGAQKVDEAIRAWQRALSVDPAYAEAYMNLGIAYQTKNRPDSAKVFWERSMKADAEFLAPHVALARLAVGERRFNDALARYTGILDLGVKDPRIFAELAFVYEQLEQYDQAIAYYEEARKLDPESSDINSSIAIVKQKQQQHLEARQANKVRVRQIVVSLKAEAEQILIQLQEGADFVELARSKSIDPSADDGGDLGFFGPGELLPAFEEVAMALKIGEISGIIETSMGFHIIKRIE